VAYLKRDTPVLTFGLAGPASLALAPLTLGIVLFILGFVIAFVVAAYVLGRRRQTAEPEEASESPPTETREEEEL